jgi:hypothetical protein
LSLSLKSPNSRELCEQISDTLDDARRLANRESVKLPTIVGLGNIHIPPDVELSFSDGYLSDVREGHRRFVPPGSSASAVLVTKTAMKILAVTEDSDTDESAMFELLKKHDDAVQQWYRDVRDTIDRVRFSLLCSSRRSRLTPERTPPFVATRQESLTILIPIEPAPRHSWEHPHDYPAELSVIDGDQVVEIESWERRFLDEPHNLSIAMRRILSAIIERRDPIDSFIDAVMAWENMFSGSPDTTLRVCGALAAILEVEDYEKRSQLMLDLKALYTLRSNLVHGKNMKEPPMQKMLDAQHKATAVALDAIRRIYDYPGMPIEDSARRSEHILLGYLTYDQLSDAPPSDRNEC